MSLKARLEADETLVTAWSGVPDALTVEIVAKQGFDHPSGGPHARELAAYIRWRGGLPIDADALSGGR